MTVPSNFELAQTGLKNKYETGFKLASHALWVTFITTKLPLDLIKENCILYKRAFGYTASAKPLTEPKEKVNIKYFFRQFSSSGQMKKLKEFADLAYKEKNGWIWVANLWIIRNYMEELMSDEFWIWNLLHLIIKVNIIVN